MKDLRDIETIGFAPTFCGCANSPRRIVLNYFDRKDDFPPGTIQELAQRKRIEFLAKGSSDRIYQPETSAYRFLTIL